MKGMRRAAALLAAGFCLPALAATPGPVAHDLGALHWRQAGPSRGGRVDAVTGVADRPDTYYFGAAAGGIWKTTDGGLHWKALFRHQDVSSIGALAVAPSDANVVYAGTGETALRSNISFGDGVYRSDDAGRTWHHVGLDATRHVGGILVDPKDPQTVVVAALGSLYRKNGAGGIYRTTDGGAHWKHVLSVNDRTGAVDLAADPDNPRILYAATWQVSRTPWSLTSGGPGSGIWKSTDGGRTWKRLTGHGLPDGPLGRIGLAVSKNHHGRQLYAMIEAHRRGLYRSDDGGGSWKRVNDKQALMQRPFYFMGVFTDPGDPDTVYVLDRGFFRSTDQGYHFARAPMQGGDNHALWINPRHPRHRIEGNDQGAVISSDGGKSWTVPYNEPIAQMYHVNTDDRYPYNLYGEQQDSGSVIVPSMSLAGRICGFRTTVGGGESGFVVPEPGDPDVIFADTYMGQLTRYNRKTKELKQVSPWPYDSHGEPASTQKYRFTWVAPLAFSPFDPDVLYMGSQVLFRSDDDGASWEAISPDLSRDDKSKQRSSGGPITKDNASAEYYDLIYAVAPSPKRKGEIWAGTDDGLVWLTRDAGKHWKKVTPPGMPKWAKVSMIEASRFDAGTAYIAVDAHKLGIAKPFIYRTTDYGRSWTRITRGLPDHDYVHVVRQDTRDPHLLFAGTERGVFVSFDDGGHWHALQLNLPTTPIHDLAVHDGDLVAATFGRGYWILDDIEPLRQYGPAASGKQPFLYDPAPARRFQIKGGGCPHGLSAGRNPPLGGLIDYYLPDKPHSATLTIRDAKGKVVRRFTWQRPAGKRKAKTTTPKLGYGGGLRSVQPRSSDFTPHRGLNRLVWNLRYQPLKKLPGEVYQEANGVAPMVLPGTYTVDLRVDGQHLAAKLTVKRNPLAHSPPGDLREQNAFLTRLYHRIDRERTLAVEVERLRRSVRDTGKTLERRQAGTALAAPLKRVAAALETVDLELHQPKANVDEELFNYPVGLDQQFSFLDYVVASGDHAPTQQSRAVYKLLSARFDQALGRWNEALAAARAFNAQASKAGLGALALPGPD